MNKKMVFRVFFGIFLLCNLIADTGVRSSESDVTDGRCKHLCTASGKDTYGNLISTRIISAFSSPQETYPTSNKFVCIPCDCGDGIKGEYEVCEDGNNVGFDGCTADCSTIEICGDSIIQTRNVDGVAEKCDDGAHNSNTKDKCRTNCQLPVCGDTIQDTGEECDLGQGNANGVGSGCDTSCRNIVCGDGRTTGGEQCDDSNQNNGDGCDSYCRLEDPCIGVAAPGPSVTNHAYGWVENICLRGRFDQYGSEYSYNLIYNAASSVDVGFASGADYRSLFDEVASSVTRGRRNFYSRRAFRF